jgi:hypothetical protein
VRLAQWRGVVDRPFGVVVAAGERGAVVCPHVEGELHDLLETLEALADRGQGDVHRARLLLVVAGTEPEPGPSAGQHVERRHRLYQDARRAEGHRRDHRPEPDLPCMSGEEPERGVGLEHLRVGLAVGLGLQQVVGQPDRVQSRGVGGPGDAQELGGQAAGACGPRVVGDVEAEAHRSAVAQL